MSALSEAVPLALAAAFSPPAMLVVILLLTGDHPRRLVLAYLIGAALVVGIVGVGGLFLLTGTGETQQDGKSASASLARSVSPPSSSPSGPGAGGGVVRRSPTRKPGTAGWRGSRAERQRV
jgi:hypothetical protein